jgi:hypothetical protein
MKKNFILAVCLFLGTMAYAQEGRIGINTSSPKTTLDVNGKTDTSGNLLSTDLTGLQAPRLTRAELTAKGNALYGTDQKGALVYITDISGGDAVSQRVNVNAIGYYYFDGALWQKMAGSGSGLTDWAKFGTTDAASTADNQYITGSAAIGQNAAATVAGPSSGSTAATQSAKLTVANGDASINTHTFGLGGGQRSGNMAVGNQSLFNNTTGDQNTAIGQLSLTTNTIGNQNIATGNESLRFNTSGSQNNAYGHQALGSNTTGSRNIAIGTGAATSISTSNNNVAIGHNSLENLTSGGSNTVIGFQAGRTQTSGSNNIVIGNTQNTANITGSNQLNIGGAIFGTGLSGNALTPAGNIGIGVTAPSNKLHVKDTADPLRLEGVQTGNSSTDRVLAIDTNGVVKDIGTLSGGISSVPTVSTALSFLPSGNTTTFLGADLGANIRQVLYDNIRLQNNSIGTFDSTTKEFTANKTGYYNFQINLTLKGPLSGNPRLGVSRPYTGAKPTTASNQTFGIFVQNPVNALASDPITMQCTGMLLMNAGEKVIFLTRFISPTTNTLDVESINYNRTFVNSVSITYFSL